MSKKVKDFRPARKNANKHTARGMGALQKSIQSDGWIGAMTTAADGEMIAGSARIETVAQVFGTDAEPIIVESDGTRPIVVVRKDIPNADDKRAQRLALADNRVHEIDLTWDAEVLAGFDADVLGDLWTPEELSDLGQQWADEQRGKQEDAGAQIDKAEELRVKWGVESGQLWQLGDYRLICGDCTDKATVERVMQGERAALIWTDPPYGVNYGAKLDAANPMGYRVRSIENDDLSPDKLEVFIRSALSRCAEYSSEGAAIYVACPAGTLLPTLIASFVGSGFTFHWGLVWVKDQLVLGRGDYHFKHENILYGWKPDGAHYFIPDRTQTSVFEYPRPKSSEEHPTMKPVELVEHMVRNSSQVGDMVLDPFLGSGTTLIACERLGRKCRAVEISPGYCAVAIERWAQTTGGTPILANGA